jgi:hypothetical protein
MGSPLFAQSVKTGKVAISTANTARDGTGAMGTVFTAGAAGSVITSILLQSAGPSGVAITAGMIRLFIDNGAGVIHLFKEIPVQAGTPSASVAGFSEMLTPGNQLPPGGLRLQPGFILKASTHISEIFHVVADYGDF